MSAKADVAGADHELRAADRGSCDSRSRSRKRSGDAQMLDHVEQQHVVEARRGRRAGPGRSGRGGRTRRARRRRRAGTRSTPVTWQPRSAQRARRANPRRSRGRARGCRARRSSSASVCGLSKPSRGDVLLVRRLRGARRRTCGRRAGSGPARASVERRAGDVATRT